jgi:Holliday junction resolvase
MPGYARKVDANSAEIKSALEQAGVFVVSLETVGRGCPDLLCIKAGKVVLIEAKAGKNKLKPAQHQFACIWRFHGGDCVTVRTVDQALEQFGVEARSGSSSA